MAPHLEITILGAGKWEGSLVGYFIDSQLPFSYIKGFMKANQKRFGKSELLANGQGYFLFKLGDVTLNEEVLEEGFWMIGGKPFVIRK